MLIVDLEQLMDHHRICTPFRIPTFVPMCHPFWDIDIHGAVPSSFCGSCSEIYVDLQVLYNGKCRFANVGYRVTASNIRYNVALLTGNPTSSNVYDDTFEH
jgi:hypothetical protein